MLFWITWPVYLLSALRQASEKGLWQRWTNFLVVRSLVIPATLAVAPQLNGMLSHWIAYAVLSAATFAYGYTFLEVEAPGWLEILGFLLGVVPAFHFWVNWDYNAALLCFGIVWVSGTFMLLSGFWAMYRTRDRFAVGFTLLGWLMMLAPANVILETADKGVEGLSGYYTPMLIRAWAEPFVWIAMFWPRKKKGD